MATVQVARPRSSPLVDENIAFDTETLTSPVGEEVTIEYDNRDDVPHNLRILTEDGEEPATEIETGPVTQTLTSPSTRRVPTPTSATSTLSR